MTILTADWHLTDNPNDEYRWEIFDVLAKQIKQRGGPLYILGDITDRKDRHSAALVNRLTAKLVELADMLPGSDDIHIIMGNHDKPINGTPFWEFLNDLAGGIRFHTEPFADQDRLFLPYSNNPLVDWDGIPYVRYHAIFMHQTVSGVVGNNGHVLENPNMPKFPRNVRVYSGDIHTPQVVSRITYVGAPHPVAFGDNYLCRLLVINDQDYSIKEEVKLSPPQKLMIRVTSLEELKEVSTRQNDQARVIYKLPLSELDTWPTIQQEIDEWSKYRRITLASCEPDIVATSALAEEEWNEAASELDLDPENVLRMFAEAEDLDQATLRAGIELLKEGKQ